MLIITKIVPQIDLGSRIHVLGCHVNAGTNKW